MAFYGSASANLSPILFKGNLFSEGVNIIMHSDVSLSMSVASPVSAASTNYTMAPRSNTDPISFTNFAANYRNSPFYDGVFPTFLQKYLTQNKVGDSFRSPNLYSYFDSTVRTIANPVPTSRQTIVENTETYTFLDSVILARDTSTLTPNLGNLKDPKQFYNFWRNRYVDNFYSSVNSFSSTYPFNIAAFNNRLDGYSTSQSSISGYSASQNSDNARLSYYSEDVQGNIISIYYSGSTSAASIKTGGNEIVDGDITRSTIGSDLYKIPRRKLPTYFISASNEQDNAAADIISTPYTTKTNVGYSTDKYQYTFTGLYARRYRGCVASIIWNPNCTKGSGNTYGTENYKEWFSKYAVPLPYGSTTSGLGEDAPGINWFENGRVFTTSSSVTGDSVFAIDIAGEPKVSYYTLSGNNYNNDPNYASNSSSITNNPAGNDDVTFNNAFVPDFLKSPLFTNYDVNFNPATNDGNTSGLVQNPVTDNNRYGGFWGPFNSLDRIRSDIQNYTMMIIGYFKPPSDGIYRFKLIASGCCAVWVSSDSRITTTGVTGSNIWQEVSGLSDNDVYSNWDSPSGATITAPQQPGDRYLSANPGPSENIDAWNEIYGDGGSGTGAAIVSDYLKMTGGRYYPIRVILSNPGSTTTGSDSNNFPVPTSLTATPPSSLNCNETSFTGAGIGNPSFIRFFFSSPKSLPTNTTSALPSISNFEWNINNIGGTPVFFGGLDVWAYGSPFFPLPQNTIQKTIKDEINERDLRVISLSSYNSDDGYDGVFFLSKPGSSTPKYRYINLLPDSYTKFDTNTELPATWRFGSYFKPITYSVSDPNIQYITGSGSNASLNVTKLNDRYLTSVSNGGVGFKTGDRIRISNTYIGGNAALNDLLLSISNVTPISYTGVTGNIEGSTRTDFPSFFVSKNANQDNAVEYTVDINSNDAGLNYSINDRLFISGSVLDGQDPQNNINLKVTSVGAGGTITGIGLIDGSPNYGSPTNRIGYGITLSTFNPLNFSSVRFDVKDCSVGYRHQVSSGAAYTTATITGISYTTLPVTGAAYSSFSISGIAYTTGSIVSIGYSTANIAGIAYTTRDIVSIGYSAANITGIAYTNADVVSIGYSSASVTAIGYTSPQVVSIGYTAFQVDNITYPEAITITSVVDTGGNPANTNIEVTVGPGAPDLTTTVAANGFVIIAGTGNPNVDGRRRIVTVINSTTIEVESNVTSLNISPSSAKLIIEDDGIVGSPVGVGSTALLTTILEHTFNVGDSIIVRGIQTPSYTSWNSTFTVQEVENTNSVWLQNTGSVGLFTATTIGAGSTVGYDQSELQLEIATPVPHQFEVGMGITVFGITGESSIYNNGYVIRSILESDGSGPYKFDVLQDQTPSQLALPGTNGKIGIHTISGIATVTSTSGFGLPGDTLNLRIENSTGSFFNKIFNNAVILDESRILLGADSHRDSTTANPTEYSNPTGNVSGSTISGRIGSPLLVQFNNLTAGYTFNAGDTIDVYNTSPTSVYNTVANSYFYTVDSVSGNTLTITGRNAGINSSFALVATSGKIGVRNLPPIITTSTVSGLTTNFGVIGQSIQVAIRGSLKSNLNSNLITWNGRIISSNQIILTDNGARDPFDRSSDYNLVGAGGTVGLIGSNLRVRTSIAHGFSSGNSVRLQNIVNQYSVPAYNGTYTISGIVNSTTFELSSTILSPSVNFGVVGTSGLVGLLADAVVTTTNDHPFVTTNNVKIQSTGNSDFDTKTFDIIRINSTSFILRNTSTGVFTDDFTTAGAGSNGIVGLMTYPATVRYTSPFIFQTGQKVSIANTNNTYGTSNGRYTITYVNDNTFTLDVNATSATDISVTDTSGFIGLMDAKPVVTYDTTHRFVNTDLKLKSGDQIKIQSTGDAKFDNNVFTVDLIQNGDPNGTFGISGNNIENSFSSPSAPNFTSYNGSAIGGLIASKLRVRSVSHNLSSTGSVRIQGTQSNVYDGNSTYTVFDTNTIDLGGFISNSGTDFTVVETSSSSARLGPHGYPAIATFSSALPSSFSTGSQIRIEGSTVGLNTNQVFTIVRYSDTRVALAETVIGNIYPSSITRVENSPNLYAGLRNSPPRVFVSNTSDFGPVGTIIRANVSGMNDFFNGPQDVRVSSSSILELIEKTNPDNYTSYIPYNLTGIDVIGVVGLANTFRVVTVSGGHNLQTFGNLAIGGQIYIRSTITTPTPSYAGRFFIREILDSNRFTIDVNQTTSTLTHNPVDYTLVDNSAYYVGVDSGARVTTTTNHILLSNQTPADNVDLVDNEGDFTNQNYTVRSVYSPTSFSLNNTYPTSGESTFDFKKATTSGTVTPRRPTGSTNSRLKINRVLNLTTGNGVYELPGSPPQAIDFITQSGNQYRTGQRFLIKGGLLGGSDSTNDLIITVGSVGVTGDINYSSTDVNLNTLPTLTGTADKTLDYSINGVPIPIESQDFTGGGSGATFNIVRSGLRTPTGIPTYTSVNVVSSGTNYIENNVIKIPGTSLGGLTPINDLYVRILSLGTGGSVNGIAITGIASDSYSVAGFSTIYKDGTPLPTIDISRPYGLEQTADFTNPPPAQGAFLEQRQNILSLAAENYGGVVKIDKVYNVGSPQKSVPITQMFFYGNMWFTSNTNDSEYFFDRSNSGICTIRLDDDNDDGAPFRNISLGDQVFIYDSLSQYLDYTSVGYALTVTAVVSSTDTAIRDSIAVVTSNTSYQNSDDRGLVDGTSPPNLKIIKATNPLTVFASNHGFLEDERVIIGITTDINGLPYETKTGLGNTTYIVKDANTNTFTLAFNNGNRVTAETILPNQTSPLINYWYDFVRGVDTGLNGEEQGSVGTNTNDGNRSPFARIIVAKGGRASVVGTGATPVDNRVGLAKAVADFITETSSF